jgi:hypothetical protein
MAAAGTEAGIEVVDFRDHLLARIDETPAGMHPFGHMFIEDVFPAATYRALRAHMLECKYGDGVADRLQDNPAYKNRRFSLVENDAPVVEGIRSMFSDPEVKRCLLARFYMSPSEQLVGALSIHDEFEYVFTAASRFQNIHVDIPPKYMSFVFYIPEHEPAEAEQAHNGTILYDRSLQPHHPARFKPNSVCIFVPHFASYHGFSSTIDRDALVMFYVSRDSLQTWQAERRATSEEPPFTGLLDAITTKLRAHPLIEFGDSEERLQAERASCLVNAPQGRVLGRSSPG